MAREIGLNVEDDDFEFIDVLLSRRCLELLVR
jgi:hypothetical protein